MPIVIGQDLESGFHDPFASLSDCHSRLEGCLDTLIAIAEERRGRKLSDAQHHELEVALRYFRDAAPKHKLDEEESLIPRLKAKRLDEGNSILARIVAHHADHEEAEIMHRMVDQLGETWITNGGLAPDYARILTNLLRELRTIYAEHFAIEDNELFPLARKVLDREELGTIALEMAARRGYVFGDKREDL